MQYREITLSDNSTRKMQALTLRLGCFKQEMFLPCDTTVGIAVEIELYHTTLIIDLCRPRQN